MSPCWPDFTVDNPKNPHEGAPGSTVSTSTTQSPCVFVKPEDIVRNTLCELCVVKCPKPVPHSKTSEGSVVYQFSPVQKRNFVIYL
ncbi:hypothetical protein BT69DRAFT_1275438 [Atractiella rhizophila]|nr:hypothetical protein BT69DRAFT_1275438 [Atractiella rhizophila]